MIHFSMRPLVRLFEHYSVSVSGDKGSGKDLITNNVIARRRLPHVSNLPTNLPDYFPFEYDKIDLKCTYKDLVSGNVPHYVFPYPMGTDIYLSDCGVYYPSQFCNELNRDYKSLPTFLGLSRQLGNCRVHQNTQSCNRVFDKIREQCDRYVRCRKTLKLPFGYFITFTTEYDRYDSCEARIRPCRVPIGSIMSPESRMMSRVARDQFYNQHGSVKDHIYIYRNKAKYDTLYFGELFGGDEFAEKRTQKAKKWKKRQVKACKDNCTV